MTVVNRVYCVAALVACVAGCGDDGSGGRPASDAGGADTQRDVAVDADRADVQLDAADAADTDTDGDTVIADTSEGDAGVDTGEPSLELDGLSVVQNPTNGLSFYVSWTTDVPATTRLDVECGDERWSRGQDSALVTSHEVFIAGFWAGATCTLTASSTTIDAAVGVAEHTLEVEGAGFPLPEIDIVATRAAAMEPGWTLVDLTNIRLGQPPTIAMVDAEGRVRWAHRLTGNASTNGNEVQAHPDGILTGGSRSSRARFVTWDGRETWRGEFQSHHEGFLMPDGERFVHLEPRQACPDGIDPVAPVVMRDFETLDVLWRWQLCDHYTPPVSFDDWDHNNGIAFDADETFFVVSARHQNALFAVATDTFEFLWVLGYGGRPEDGFNGDFAMAEEDRFLEQHAPQILDNGNIVLFDNGSCTACLEEVEADYTRGWSRAIEIAYDVDAGTAEVVWEFRPDEDIYAPIWGDADRLPGGTTLVTFGRKPEVTVIIEADAEGEEIWRMSYPQAVWGSYRAERVSPVYGFAVVPDVD